MEKCDKGWHSGECCCNCKSQLRLMCHPYNKEIGNGSILTPLGYICIVRFDDGSNEGKAIFFEKEHGMCELHMFKD